MDIVAKALTADEIRSIQARQAAEAAPKPAARQVAPEGFEIQRSITLGVPVELDGTTYGTATVRRLKGRDFLALQRLQGDENVALLSIVTGLPAEVIGELDAADFIALSELAQDFLPQVLREAGGTTSADGRSSQP